MAKLKNGTFTVSVEEEQIVWTDRKRILGLPISFTKYSLSETKLLVNTGLFNVKEEEMRLYRIRDLRFTQSFVDKLFGVGSICVDSTDVSLPHLDIKHVKQPRKVKDVLSASVEQSRKRNGIRATEIIAGGGAGHGVEARGDEGIFADENQNGIDDALE